MTAKEAAELVKQRISVPANSEAFSSNYLENEGRGQWEFQWKGKKETVSATLDVGTGDVTSFYGYGQDYSGDTKLVPKISRSQAVATAQEFLKKSVPSRVSSFRLVDTIPERSIPLNYNRDHAIYFERVINGVSCPFNGAEFRISAATGKITYFYVNWDYTGTFPSAASIISGEKAAQTMKNSGLELMYFRPYPAKEGQQREVKLVYGINEPRRVLVDAITGKFVTSSYFYTLSDAMYDLGGMGGEGGMAKSEVGGLTPIEEKEVTAVANLLSKEKAQEAVFKYFKLPDGFVLDNARLFEDDRKDRIWQLGWTLKSEGKGSGYMSASVDAQNGELLSYSKSVYVEGSEKEQNKYSAAEAKAIGEKFLQNMQPVKMGQVKYVDRQDYLEASRTAMLTYARLVNGIPFYEDSISVEVDRVTGEVISFNVQWGKFVFPKASPAVSLDVAYSNLTAVNSLKMGYLRTEEPKFDRSEQKIGLYYYFQSSQPRLVDANSGKVLLDTGEEYTEKGNVEFTDIGGHSAEADIKLLQSLGVVGGASDKYEPNASAVNADFIKMLVLASGWSAGEGEQLEGVPDTWYRPYYQTAVYHGVLSADSLPEADQVVSRMDCARWLVSAAGLKKAATLEGIYQVPAKDAAAIPEKDAGYAAIALKLGLLPSINGKFSGDSVITRGQTATALVGYMKVADE